MKKWIIEFWTESSGKSPIERWLDRLTQEKSKAVAKEIRLLELSGNALKLPHSRSLGKGLFELRERRYGCRIYYCFDMKKQEIIVLLAAGDKATQERDIEIARERLSKTIKSKGN